MIDLTCLTAYKWIFLLSYLQSSSGPLDKKPLLRAWRHMATALMFCLWQFWLCNYFLCYLTYGWHLTFPRNKMSFIFYKRMKNVVFWHLACHLICVRQFFHLTIQLKSMILRKLYPSWLFICFLLKKALKVEKSFSKGLKITENEKLSLTLFFCIVKWQRETVNSNNIFYDQISGL